MIEYTKYQWIDQHNHDAFQWARNAQNIIFYDNELKNIYSLREKHISFNFFSIINIIFVLQFLPMQQIFLPATPILVIPLLFSVVTIYIFEFRNYKY